MAHARVATDAICRWLSFGITNSRKNKKYKQISRILLAKTQDVGQQGNVVAEMIGSEELEFW